MAETAFSASYSFLVICPSNMVVASLANGNWGKHEQGD